MPWAGVPLEGAAVGMDTAVPLTPSPLPGPGPAGALLAGSRGFRRASPSLASSASSSFSAMGASAVAGSIAAGVDGTGQRQMLSDRYALGEELGRGAFGQVFKGMDTRSGEAVAIKQMCGLLACTGRTPSHTGNSQNAASHAHVPHCLGPFHMDVRP